MKKELENLEKNINNLNLMTSIITICLHTCEAFTKNFMTLRLP